jgi:cell division protease FtsH
LLHGKSGSGKRLLAKAMIKASQQNFIHIQGTILDKMDIEKVEQLFITARKQGICIIFIENFDLFIKNQLYDESGKASEVFNLFVQELKNLKNNGEPIILLATTNDKNYVDASLPADCTRSEEPIFVPSLEERLDFLRRHLWTMVRDCSDLEFIARKTKNFTYSQLLEISNFAKQDAVNRGLSFVDKKFLEELSDHLKKHYTSIQSEEDLYKTAIHEASHAVIGINCKSVKIRKASILQDGYSAGRVMLENIKNCILSNEDWIIYNLAGGVGEQEFQLPKEKTFTHENRLQDFLLRESISGDIKQAETSARALILAGVMKQLCLNDKNEIDESKLKVKIDEQIASSFKTTCEMVHQKRDAIKRVADRLYEKEIIYEDEIYNLINDSKVETADSCQ